MNKIINWLDSLNQTSELAVRVYCTMNVEPSYAIR